MDDFNKQLKRNLRNNISEFNTNPKYSSIRDLYKTNFDSIVTFINKIGHKLAIEDIAQLDNNLTQQVMDNHLLLKEINKAISSGELKLSDIK